MSGINPPARAPNGGDAIDRFVDLIQQGAWFEKPGQPPAVVLRGRDRRLGCIVLSELTHELLLRLLGPRLVESAGEHPNMILRSVSDHRRVGLAQKLRPGLGSGGDVERYAHEEGDNCCA